MIHFVCILRKVDDWERNKSKRARALYEGRSDANVSFLKDPLSKSGDFSDLVEYCHESRFDFKFLFQLSSIERVLNDWYSKYSLSLLHD